ncbi:MAG: HNH endonuclease [Planctomycetota bacterium]
MSGERQDHHPYGTIWLEPDSRSAIQVDQAAVRLLRSRGVIDIALGEALDRLFEGDRLLQLGYSRQVDFSRERLGMPPRTMFGWVRLARELRERPLLRKAVVVGAVPVRKALAILPVAKGKAERAWTAAAMTSTLETLEAGVRQEGKRPGTEDDFEVEVLWLRMDESQQDRLEAAIAVARKTLSMAAPRWQCEEAIAQEWLGAHGAWCPSEEEQNSLPANPKKNRKAWRAAKKEMKKRARAVLKQLAAIDEADALVEGLQQSAGEDALSLDALIQRLLKARRGFDEAFGALALQIVEGKVWKTLGYHSQGDYVQNRLGISVSTFRSRVWLERRLRDLPELREVLSSGRLSFSKALLLAKGATPHNIKERIEEACSTTCQQVERESTKEEDKKNRKAGVRRIWGPKDAARTLALAIASAQALHEELGEPIDEGEALAVIADYFVEVWSKHKKGIEWSLSPAIRRTALLRHGGLCAVPGCSRAAEHLHHGVFRSHGGPDEPWNLIGLCSPHHLHGAHKGYLTVKGRAGERLVWRLGISELVALEEWETHGDDDVRRIVRVGDPGCGNFIRDGDPPECTVETGRRAGSGQGRPVRRRMALPG